MMGIDTILFIDTIGVNSGSHLYVKSRQVNKNVKNGKEFEVNTRIENNGNFAAAIGQNELTYKVTLPENFEYVDNSTEVSFVNGMCLIYGKSVFS